MFLGDLTRLTAGFDPVFVRVEAEDEELLPQIETLYGHDDADFEDEIIESRNFR